MPPATQRAAAAAGTPVFLPNEPEPHVEQPVERTSIADRHFATDEITVRFLRWHPFGNTAYQPREFAGFKRDVALRLVAQGVAVIAQLPEERRDVSRQTLVTK